MEIRATNATPCYGNDGFVVFGDRFWNIDDTNVSDAKVLCCSHDRGIGSVGCFLAKPENEVVSLVLRRGGGEEPEMVTQKALWNSDIADHQARNVTLHTPLHGMSLRRDGIADTLANPD